MNIEHFYYDEMEKWIDETQLEMEENEKKMSEEEKAEGYRIANMELQKMIQKAKDANSQVYRIVNPEKYRWFQEIAEEVILFSQLSGCNVKIETMSDMKAVIRIQTSCIWLFNDGETAREEKQIIRELLDQAEHVYIGTSERNGKDILDIQLIFKLYGELKKTEN